MRIIRSPMGVLAALLLILAAPAAHAILVHEKQEIQIPMRDTLPGTGQPVFLAADRYLPESGEGPWPAILIQTPYVKELNALEITRDQADSPLFNSLDYAFVILDWRGFGISGSQHMNYLGSPTRGEDGYDAVEWIAAQPWCDGNVAGWGASALGNAQMLTAAAQPPHLVCSVPIVYHYREWYDLYFPGGIYMRNVREFVASYFGVTLARENPLRNSVWDFVETQGGDPADIDIPLLHITGWYDHETLQTVREFRDIQTAGGPNARGQQWLLIGPWSHSAIDLEAQNELAYPAAAGEAATETLRFLDYHLRGIDNGWETRPPVRYFQMNEDAWREAPDWPPAPGVTQTLYPNAAGQLVPELPVRPAFASYLSNPADPIAALCGYVLPSDYAVQGPADLRSLETRNDVLQFQTPLLDEPLQLAGNIRAFVWLETAAVDTDVVLRLAQRYPDGRLLWLADGVRRASLRNGFREKEPLEAGEIVEVPVEFPPLAVTIPAGHQLVLLLMPSAFDAFDVNPQDGSNFSDEPGAVPTAALVNFYAGGNYPARLLLPVPGAEPEPASVTLRVY